MVGSYDEGAKAFWAGGGESRDHLEKALAKTKAESSERS